MEFFMTILPAIVFQVGIAIAVVPIWCEPFSDGATKRELMARG